MRPSRFSSHGRTKRTLGLIAVAVGTAAILIVPSQPPEAGLRDRDHDGLSNRFEVKRSRTNPRKADTDADRLRDGFEVKRSRTNPRKADTDGDGLRDRFELRKSKTNPRRRDTDRDGYSDGVEVFLGSNPRDRNSIPRNPSPTRSFTPPPPTTMPGVNCMPAPRVCGFPDVENVGLSNPSALTPTGSVTLSTAGQVFENKEVNGCVTVRAPNVTIRNVKIRCDTWYPIRSIHHGGHLEGNTGGLLIEDVEVDQLDFTGAPGIAFDNYTARRVFVHNGSDCFTSGLNVVIEDSLCSIGPDLNDDGWADSNAFCSQRSDHFDGVNGDFVTRNVTIRRNTIRNPCGQTSNILIGYIRQGSANITIDGNLLAGGGWTVYCDQNQPKFVDVVFKNNRFARTFFPRSGYWGPATACNDHGGNVWDDTGARIPGL
jgi:hypothetical protein